MDPSAATVSGTLEHYCGRFEALLRPTPVGTQPREHKAAVQQALRSLKDDLDREYRRLVRAGRGGRLSRAELRYLLPAIEQSLAGIHVCDAADPSMKLWRTDVMTGLRTLRGAASGFAGSQGRGARQAPWSPTRAAARAVKAVAARLHLVAPV